METVAMDTTTRLNKLTQLADMIECQTREKFIKDGMNPELHEK